jgi:hypothetical protein
MKKIITTLLAIFFCLNVFSQDIYKVIRCGVEEYINSTWVEKRFSEPDNMFVVVNGTNIKFTNQAETSLFTYGQKRERYFTNHKTLSWDAYDNKGSSLVFMMKFPHQKSLSVQMLLMYDSYCFTYEVLVQ